MKLPIKIPNSGHRIKVRIRQNKNDSHSIFLYYQLMVDGKRHTGKKTMQGKLILKPSSKDSDKKILLEAIQVRDHIEYETRDRAYDLFRKEADSNIDLISYMRKLSTNYEGNTYKTWDKAIKHAVKFFGQTYPINDLTRGKCREYSEHLKKQMSSNSANTYYQRFKQSIKRMVDDQLLDYDIASNITIPSRPSERQYLTLDEINIIARMPIQDIHVKNAFLFSCFTGLRYGDLEHLGFDNVENGHINITMRKTKDKLSFLLPPDAQKIIEQQKIINEYVGNNRVFQFRNYESARRKWERFFKTTGIDKKITFHCARHTFATLCVTSDIDIFTISKLLGHKDVKVTQVYMKLLDRKKDEAIAKLPTLS